MPLRNDRTLCVEEAHTSIMTGFRYVSEASPEVGEWRDQAASALLTLRDSGQQVLRKGRSDAGSHQGCTPKPRSVRRDGPSARRAKGCRVPVPDEHSVSRHPECVPNETAHAHTGGRSRLQRSAGGSVVNVNLQLSERLLEVTSRRHPNEVQRTLVEVVSEQGSHTNLLDNTEILLNPALWLAPPPPRLPRQLPNSPLDSGHPKDFQHLPSPNQFRCVSDAPNRL